MHKAVNRLLPSAYCFLISHLNLNRAAAFVPPQATLENDEREREQKQRRADKLRDRASFTCSAIVFVKCGLLSTIVSAIIMYHIVSFTDSPAMEDCPSAL